MSPKEKAIFFIFSVIFLISAGGIIFKVNAIYSIEIPKYGGSFKEGVVGIPRFINPLLAVSDVDKDLTELVYAGLLRPDGKGRLSTGIAEKYEISEDGLSYTFYLNPKAEWHDGKPITADDVLFTVQLAKNPFLNSLKRANWEGVEVEKINDYQVVFYLKKPFAPFLENATLGIMPKHIWGDMPMEHIGLSNLNIEPIGSGPYKLKEVKRNSSGIITSYILKANKDFVLDGPYIKTITFDFYPSEEKLMKDYGNNKAGAAAISSQNSNLTEINGRALKTLNLPRIFGVFFNQNNSMALADIAVRKALDAAIDKDLLVKEVLNGYGLAIDSPIPPGVLGALKPDSKTNKKNNAEETKDILEKAGWKFDEKEAVFIKKNKKETIKLEFSISTSNNQDLVKTAEILKKSWEAAGIKVNLKIFEIGDLNQLVIRPRKYEALLFGEIVGRDPDPFAFWHSSQRNDPGLNIALYTNIKVDNLLEKARSVSNTLEREKIYEDFQIKIKEDIPAIFLYSPQYLYVIPNNLKGFEAENITIPSERFSAVNKWYVKTKKVWPIFVK